MKSKRNKTIDFNIQEGQRYLKNCITADDTLSAEKIIDKTIVGDTFDVLKKLPRGIFDLIFDALFQTPSLNQSISISRRRLRRIDRWIRIA